VTVAYASDILDPSPLLLSFPPLYTYFLNWVDYKFISILISTIDDVSPGSYESSGS
jgi:hypothetical protein